MCGIAGSYGSAELAAVRRMVKAQAHRGPDDDDVWADPGLKVSLGHARLAIIDTSRAGRQPMSYAGGRLWVAFNGEIYNYRELREELERAGHRFATRSDTEVLLAAYAAWGPECFGRLTGMFAAAVVDREPPPGAPQLVLVRDRLGIKPLVYGERDGVLWFASELRALRASGCLRPVVDPEAVLDYLAVGAVFQPRTFLLDARALPPGHRMEVGREGRRLVPYWDLHDATALLRRELAGISAAEATERVRHALRDATRYHLIADVPVGAFLSGGVDSSVVVGSMTEVGGKPVRTFSVGFEETYSALDERRFAREAASHLRSAHTEIVVSSAEARDIFHRVVRDIDQPSIDGTNTWIVSRAAREHVTVALSGLGGDELFAGYPHFRLFRAAPSRGGLAEALSARLLQWVPRWRSRAEELRMLSASPEHRLAMLRRIVRDKEITRVARAPFTASFRERLAARQRPFLRDDADPIQQASYAEVRGYLLSTLLRDGDVMSMAHALEVRPVLLHHPLVELVYALPDRLKLDPAVNKPLLVHAASEYLPPALQTRAKMGFELPFSGWISRELAGEIEALLQTAAARAVFNPSYLRRVIARVREGDPPRATWAWAILLAHIREHGYEVTALAEQRRAA